MKSSFTIGCITCLTNIPQEQELYLSEVMMAMFVSTQAIHEKFCLIVVFTLSNATLTILPLVRNNYIITAVTIFKFQNPMFCSLNITWPSKQLNLIKSEMRHTVILIPTVNSHQYYWWGSITPILALRKSFILEIFL